MTFQGKFDFKLDFRQKFDVDPPKRSNSWSYSESLNKLYMKYTEPCRVGVSFAGEMSSTAAIRLYAEYRPSDVILDPVVRCQKHARSSKDPHLFPDHVIRCDYPNASYHRDAHTQFRSIVVPVSALKRESDCYLLEFRYVCYSSCLAKRERVHSVFVLQDGDLVLGRCSVETRVCASPNRDLRSDESRKRKRELPGVASPVTQVVSVSHLESMNAHQMTKYLEKVNRWIFLSESGDEIVPESHTPSPNPESWNDPISSQSLTDLSQHSITSPPPKAPDRPSVMKNPGARSSSVFAESSKSCTISDVPSRCAKESLIPTNLLQHSRELESPPLQFTLYTKPAALYPPSLPFPRPPSNASYLHTNGHAHPGLPISTFPNTFSPYPIIYPLDRKYEPLHKCPPPEHSSSFVSPSKKFILQDDTDALEEIASSQQTNSQMSLS